MLFADFINWAMEQADLTNYKLAKRIGVSQTTIANWANGTSEPRERRRAEVLKLFGVDEYDLEEGFPEIHYEVNTEKAPTPEDEHHIENPDIRMIARAGKKMTPEQAENVRKYAQYMYPEAFEE